MTALDLIKASLRKIGVLAKGQTIDSSDASDARTALNLLLEEWENDTTLSLNELQSFSISDGTGGYSIGDGETWDGSKPLNVLSAYVTVGGYDYQLIISDITEYMEITDKDAEGTPTHLFYVPSNSTGTVYLFPAPSASGTITILNKKSFTQYSSGDTDIDLPAGYKSALIYNLAMELYPEYEGVNIPQWLLKRAENTKETIKKTNTVRPIPIKFDPILTGSTKSSADVLNNGYF